jgi:predicted transcriptional regulator
MNELEEIKKIRKKIGLTQSDLAKKAQVSQSLIAKIESGRIEPTFSNVKRIFEVLNSLNNDEQAQASEIMMRKIIECRRDDTIAEVIGKMRKFSISQMPVFEGNVVIGIVSESTIINKVSELNGNISALKAEDVMEDCPPIVNAKTSSAVISSLLRYFPMVLVSEKGKIAGLITKADLLRSVSKSVQ